MASKTEETTLSPQRSHDGKYFKSVGSNVESIYVEKLGGSLSKDDIHKILVEGAIEVSGGLERFLSKQELRDENTDLICTSAGM
ncbi:hypothetical protein JHK82_017312 [Glycine max]|nr:hypothetical protein JHK82_017312 [Glycine max]